MKMKSQIFSRFQDHSALFRLTYCVVTLTLAVSYEFTAHHVDWMRWYEIKKKSS